MVNHSKPIDKGATLTIASVAAILVFGFAVMTKYFDVLARIGANERAIQKLENRVDYWERFYRRDGR